MKVYSSSQAFPRDLKPILALGNFDGVHLAHQAMFRIARERAKGKGGLAVAYTFDPHPVKVLSRSSAPAMINTLPQKLELMEKTGLDAVIVEPFDLSFATLGASEWFEEIVMGKIGAIGLVAGYDFTFGSRRSGTIETLHALCDRHAIDCSILPAQLLDGTLISSTQIRRRVGQGDVKRAAELLGREFFIDGEVVRGAGRGAKLGIPTANLQTDNELLPLSGVYACRATLEGRDYRAVANLGTNPTFGGKSLGIEAHLLDFNQDIYGKRLRLHFASRIRDEKSFESIEQLVAQIRRDIGQAEELLKNPSAHV